MKRLLSDDPNHRPGKRKYFLYNPIESVESYINMLTSYDSLLSKKWYLKVAVINESKVPEIKEANANKEITLKCSKTKIQKCQ